MLRKINLAVLGISLALEGCVSTDTYRRSQNETAACMTQKQSLAQQVDTLAKQNSDLTQAAADKDAELAKLKGSYDQVVGSLQDEISSGQIQVTQLKDKLTLKMVEKILFNSGQAQVKDSGKKVLDRIGAALKYVQDKDIRVEGYTDNVPLSPKLTDRFPSNWELSTARATNVVRYLTETVGLDPSHLIAAGFGQYHPISDNSTEEGRAQNRRIDIVLVPREISGNAANQHVQQSSGTNPPSSKEHEGPSGLVPSTGTTTTP